MKITQWREKFTKPKKILDFQPIKTKRLCKNYKSTKEESNKTIKKVNNSNKKFKSC